MIDLPGICAGTPNSKHPANLCWPISLLTAIRPQLPLLLLHGNVTSDASGKCKQLRCGEEKSGCREEKSGCGGEKSGCGEEETGCGEEETGCGEEETVCGEQKVYFGATVQMSDLRGCNLERSKYFKIGISQDQMY